MIVEDHVMEKAEILHHQEREDTTSQDKLETPSKVENCVHRSPLQDSQSKGAGRVTSWTYYHPLDWFDTQDQVVHIQKKSCG